MEAAQGNTPMPDWNSGGWRPDGRDDDGDEHEEHDDREELEDQDGDEDSLDDAEGPVEIRVVTPMPVALRLEPVEREETRAGERAYATFLAGDGASERPIAVNSLPAELVESLLASALFAVPRHLMASLHEESGGLRGLVSALVPQDEVERWARAHEEAGESEPWRASVPDVPSFEAAASEDDEDDEEATPVVPIPLGVVVRFPENRRHPDDVVREAADLIASLLGGAGMDAKQKKVENLLDGL